MKKVISCIILPFLLGASTLYSGELPEQLSDAGDPTGPPVWLSVEQATNIEGELNLTRFHRHHHRSLLFELPPRFQAQYDAEAATEYLRLEETPDKPPTAAPPCVVTSSPLFEDGTNPPQSLSDLAGRATLVFSAVVGQERKKGFFDGRPVTLLELGPIDVLRASADYNHETLYLSYPEVRFWIGERHFCNEVSSLPPLPAPGTRILLFAYFPPKDLAGHVVEVQPFGFLAETSDSLWIPFFLETDPTLGSVSDFESLLDRIRAEVENSGPLPSAYSRASRALGHTAE